MRGNKILEPKYRAIEPFEDFKPDGPSWVEPESEREDKYQRGGFQVAMMTREEVLDDPEFPPLTRPSQERNLRFINTSVVVERKPLPSRPTFMDRVGRTMQQLIPERIGMPIFVIAGLSSVLQHPNSFAKVMVMHLFPLLISLYSNSYQLGPFDNKPIGPSALPDLTAAAEADPPTFPRPKTPDMTRRQILRNMLARSDKKVRFWRDPKMIYLSLGATSVVLRAWLTIQCFLGLENEGTRPQRAWQTLTLLFPATFFRHPAQSSISSDHVCVALSATAFVLIESGLWLWKAANACPSSLSPTDEEPDFDNPEPESDEGRGIRRTRLQRSCWSAQIVR